MWKKRLEENTFFILICLIRDFFISIWKSFVLLIGNFIGEKQGMLKENNFLDAMNFFFHTGPKSFWKAPSWLKIGRSPGTFLSYIFAKRKTFTPKKK